MEQFWKSLIVVVRQLRIIWVVVAASVAVPALARTERNSFLEWPANSAAALGRQAKLDYRVSDRFERHFRLNQADTVAYLNSLHLATLDKPGTFEMYSALPDGRLKMHKIYLRRGTRIFADSKGTPILRAKCANPISMGKEFPRPQPAAEAEGADSEEKLTVVQDHVGEVAPDLLIAGVEPSLPVEDLVANTIPPVENPEPTPPGTPGPGPGAAVLGGPGLGALPVLGLLGVPISTGRETTHVTTTPEVPPVFALGAGLLLVGLVRRRAKT